MAARMAFTTCVAGSQGLRACTNGGSSCSGNDPPHPVTWMINSSTATALPRFANAATSAYIRNVNTSPAIQKHSMNSVGSATCTCKNSRFPRPITVVCASDKNASTPKRPMNSWRGCGSDSCSRVRSETVGFTTTRIKSDPMNRASVVYSGAMAEPKFSAGNTASRSMPTGAASAFDKSCASAPSTARSASASPATSASSTPSASVSSSRAVSRNFCAASSTFARASPSTSAADPADADRSAPDERRPSRPSPMLAASTPALSASCCKPGLSPLSNEAARSSEACRASAASRSTSAR